MIQIKGQYTLDDFKKAQRLHARQGAAASGSPILLVIVIALFYLSLLLLVLLGRLQAAYLLAPLAILVVFLLFQYLYRPYLLKRVFNRQKDLSAPFELELSESGLSVSNPQGNALIPWSDFKKWAEGKEMILLYRSQNTFQMIPKRLFSAEGDLQYLREQLAQNKVARCRQSAEALPAHPLHDLHHLAGCHRGHAVFEFKRSATLALHEGIMGQQKMVTISFLMVYSNSGGNLARFGFE